MEVPHSLCMACGESGLTRMILTKIPFFREVIVSSFECDTCGWSNNEVQFGGEIQEKGCRYELKVTEESDLNRQVRDVPAWTWMGMVGCGDGFLGRWTAGAGAGWLARSRLKTRP